MSFDFRFLFSSLKGILNTVGIPDIEESAGRGAAGAVLAES